MRQEKMIKSPLRYPGGKSRVVKKIAALVPDFEEFREPFLGGGSVFIYLRQVFPDKKFWVNDLHYELYKFWEMSQKNVEALVDQIWHWRNWMPEGKELHRYLHDNLLNFNDIERAAAFFIFNRITFSGTSLSGGFSQSAFMNRFTPSSIERLERIGNLLAGTKITHADYRTLLNAPGKNVFIFLDPPYYSAKKSALYGKNGQLHKQFDHEAFASSMKKCPHRWLITYDDSPYIRELFSFARVYSWNLTYGMRNVTVGSNQNSKEIVISNFLEQLPAHF